MNKQEAKKARKEFREKVFVRDGYDCVMCDTSDDEELDAHHIINRNHVPYGGYVPNNGITLCPDCHRRAEDTYFWKIKSEYFDMDYRPENLFKAIGAYWLDVVKECTENQKELDRERKS